MSAPLLEFPSRSNRHFDLFGNCHPTPASGKEICVRPGGCDDRSAKAFSLLELLVVIAIIGILAGLTIPAFNSIGQARGVTEAAYQVAAAVELARNEAVARQTHVWLALQNQTNFGNTDLRVGLAFSKDGSSTNINSANLQPLGRPLLIQRAGMVSFPEVQSLTGLTGVSDLSTNSAGTLAVANRNFTNTLVTFTPDGEAMLARSPGQFTPFDPLIGLGLRNFRGTNGVPGNDAALVIDGSMATPRIFQP